jgi:transposase
MVGPRFQRATFVARVHELVAFDRLIGVVTDCMLTAWEVLWASPKSCTICECRWSPE